MKQAREDWGGKEVHTDKLMQEIKRGEEDRGDLPCSTLTYWITNLLRHPFNTNTHIHTHSS